MTRRLSPASRAALVGAAISLALLPAAGCNAVPTWTPGTATSPTPTASATPSAAATATPSPTPTRPPAPTLVPARIPYGEDRQQQMADYALRRYGTATSALQPHAIVLHFTEGGDDPWSTINYFASNVPNDGSLPGVCTHFVVDKSGAIYDLVPTDLMCRHTIGLNHVALGIEIVQSTEGHSSTWADEQILARTAQIDAVLALVRHLQAEFAIPTDRVLGHGTANEDPEFLDLTGRRNDHTDIGPAAVTEIRARLAVTP